LRAPEWRDLHSDLAALHAAALAAADPVAAVSRALALGEGSLSVAGDTLPLAREARLWMVAAGKAARGMAVAALAALEGRISGGVVAHPHGAPAAPRESELYPAGVRRFAAAHPVPDEGSLTAGDAVRSLLAGVAADDLVLVLLSGGASSVLESLPPGLSLAGLCRVTEALQRRGADIGELNTVRRALSLLKGGGLARLARPGRVVTLALSDVLGDRPETIGSGPTVASPTGPGDALRILERTGVATEVPEVVSALAAASASAAETTPPAGVFHVVASNRQSAQAMAEVAAERGFRALVMTTFLQGEAREVGRAVGGCAASVAAHGIPFAAPACLVFGGETTVTVRGDGRGGRNQELALGAALALSGFEHAAVLAFATDGVDGRSDAAGAVVTGETSLRAASLGLSPHRALAENDSEPFFRALGCSWGGGPTGTNVNDLAVALVYP